MKRNLLIAAGLWLLLIAAALVSVATQETLGGDPHIPKPSERLLAIGLGMFSIVCAGGVAWALYEGDDL